MVGMEDIPVWRLQPGQKPGGRVDLTLTDGDGNLIGEQVTFEGDPRISYWQAMGYVIISDVPPSDVVQPQITTLGT